MSHTVDQGETIRLLIEALGTLLWPLSTFLTCQFQFAHCCTHWLTWGQISFSSDMFLIGTALLTFGMGMYTMFYGSQSIQQQARHVDTSHLGAFNLKVNWSLSILVEYNRSITHVLVLLTRSYKSIPEAERRCQDQVRHAGEDEDQPCHTPAAPGGGSWEVQERAAAYWTRHGLLWWSGARFLC